MRDMKEVFVASQKERLSLGVIDRRRFLSGMVAAGVSLPVAISLADDVFAQTPKRGGHFRMGASQGSTTDTLDPATYEQGFVIAMGYMYGNHLTEVSNEGELIPELSESFDSSDAKTWVFKLRRGVEFHNGKTLTADDVISSINHHRGEESKSAAKGVVDQISDIRKDGNDTVVIELSTPNADFPTAASDYHLLIMPSSDGKVDALSGIGTGGYIVEQFEPGVRLTVRRNPNYWKSDAAYFDSVESIPITDVTARQSALLNGDVDVVTELQAKTVSLMERNPNIKILETTGTFHYTFPMRLDTPPFDNYDLRMALKLAVKRQELVDKILLGHGSIGNDSPLSPVANRYAAKNIPQREFDADKASFHYKKSGHSGRLQLSSGPNVPFPGAVDAAQLISASAREAGIDVEVVREPDDGYWSNVWNKKGWCASFWGGRPTADWMFTSAYIEGIEWNETAWMGTPSADKFNKLVVEAKAELDPVKRQALYEEAQVLLHDDGGAIIPMFANYIDGVSKKVSYKDKVAANWAIDGLKAPERWWFA